MTFSDLEGHSPILNVLKCDFLYLSSSWQDFNWNSTSCGASMAAALLSGNGTVCHIRKHV